MILPIPGRMTIGAACLAAGLAGGGWLVHKADLGQIAAQEARYEALLGLMRVQEASIARWKADGELMAAKVAAAEAQKPQVVEHWKETVRVITETALQPDAKCEEVIAWQRARFSDWALAWSLAPRP